MTPLLKLGYLLALAVGLFFLRDPRLVGGLALLQLLLWAGSRLDFRMLGRIGRRLAIFFVLITLVHAFLGVRGAEEADWRELGLGIRIDLAGLAVALVMVLRVLALVLASTWVQKSGEPGDFGRAMIQARVPRFLAWSIEATLALLTVRGGGGGGGRGGGRGRGGGSGEPVTLARLRSGDFGFLLRLLGGSIERARSRIRAEHPDIPADLARDLALISGISLAAMGLKMIQVMPGLPVAPGHKNLLLLPFILLASKRTTGRFGGLWCSATIGLISFFLGFGKYGIFEIAHFLVPGLIADLLLPLVHGRGWWRLLQLIGVGAVMGAGRFAASFLVILLVGSDWTSFWAILAVYSPMLVSQVLFGGASGFVSAFLLRSDDWLTERGPGVEAERGGGGRVGKKGEGNLRPDGAGGVDSEQGVKQAS